MEVKARRAPGFLRSWSVFVDRKSLDLCLSESDLMKISATIHIMAPFRQDLARDGFIQSTP